MDNKPVDEVVADTSSSSKWRTLMRQHSEKIGTIAEDVVLPKNERTIRRGAKAEGVEMQNLYTSVPIERVECDRRDVTETKSEHFPIFMIGISVVQVILFYSFNEDVLTMKLAYDPHRRHEIWRFITVMLVHSGYSHLWWNVVIQLLLGVFLEIVHKWKRIAIIYLASVVGGSLCTTVLQNETYSAGASAGVFGLVFSHLATIILNWHEMDRKFSRLFCVLLYVTYNVALPVYKQLVLKEDSDTGHSAHLGGAITGFLVSILVLKNFHKHPWEKTMQKICIGILIACFAIVLIINFTCWDCFPPTEWNFNYEMSYDDYDDYDEGSNGTQLNDGD